MYRDGSKVLTNTSMALALSASCPTVQLSVYVSVHAGAKIQDKKRLVGT